MRFVGGVWDGQVREVSTDHDGSLPHRLVVAVESWQNMRRAAEEIPTNVLHPTDEYQLEKHTDHTRIPERVYRLRSMTR